MEARNAIAPELLAPRLPALGYIKIGGKKAETKTSGGGKDFQPPVKYDHFKIRTRTRGSDGNFLPDEAVHAIIGPEPKELDVRLPFDHRAENFYAQMTQYSGRTRTFECNGLECLNLSTHVPTTCSRRKGETCSCKPYGRLAVILEAAPTFGGLYVFRTTSWESVNSLQTALRLFEEQFGSLRGLPLKLVVYPAEVTYRQGNDTKTGTAHKVALVLRANFDEARQATLDYHRTNRLAKREILQLASGTVSGLQELDRADAGEIGEEYFPKPAPAAPSKLGELNAAILQGTPVPDPLEESIADLRKLVEQLRARMTTAQVRRIDEAIGSRDAEHIAIAIDWAKGHLEQPQGT